MSTFLSSLGLLGIIVSLKISLVPSGRYFNTKTYENSSVLDKDNLSNITSVLHLFLAGCAPPSSPTDPAWTSSCQDQARLSVRRLFTCSRYICHENQNLGHFSTCCVVPQNSDNQEFYMDVSVSGQDQPFSSSALPISGRNCYICWCSIRFNLNTVFSVPKRKITYSQTVLVPHEILNLKKLRAGWIILSFSVLGRKK